VRPSSAQDALGGANARAGDTDAESVGIQSSSLPHGVLDRVGIGHVGAAKGDAPVERPGNLVARVFVDVGDQYGQAFSVQALDTGPSENGRAAADDRAATQVRHGRHWTSIIVAAPVSPAAQPVNIPRPPPRSCKAHISSMIPRAPVGPCGCP
jgi:hypothetical protein